MKIYNKEIHNYRFNPKHKYLLTITTLLLLLLFAFYTPAFSQQNASAMSQQKSIGPAWWFGVSGGANLNHYHGITNSLNRDVTASPAFDKGHATGVYAAAIIEYHRPGTFWGFMLHQGLDNRQGKFDNAGRKLELNLSYFTVEPGIMLFIPKTGLYAFAGPRFGFVLSTDFEYTQANGQTYPNPADPNATDEVYFRNVRKNPISMHVGLGYNIMVTQKSASNQFIIAPFVTYLPSLGRNLRTIESLKLNTLRAGITLKAGRMSSMQ